MPTYRMPTLQDESRTELGHVTLDSVLDLLIIQMGSRPMLDLSEMSELFNGNHISVCVPVETEPIIEVVLVVRRNLAWILLRPVSVADGYHQATSTWPQLRKGSFDEMIWFVKLIARAIQLLVCCIFDQHWLEIPIRGYRSCTHFPELKNLMTPLVHVLRNGNIDTRVRRNYVVAKLPWSGQTNKPDEIGTVNSSHSWGNFKYTAGTYTLQGHSGVVSTMSIRPLWPTFQRIIPWTSRFSTSESSVFW